MLYLNVGYQWGVLDRVDVDGCIYRASALDRESASRREMRTHEHILFDPQLYILDFPLSPDECRTTLGNIATYSWFGMPVPDYDSGESRVSDWRRGVRDSIATSWDARQSPSDRWDEVVTDAVTFQDQLGCSRIILPATMISDPNTALDLDMQRLDRAIEVASGLTDRPLLASVPLLDQAVRYRAPMANQLVDALADHISVRDQLHGAYVLLASEAPPKVYVTDANAAGAVLRLVQLVGSMAHKEVVVNFVEALGIVACTLGASAYATGYSRKDRRMSFIDLKGTGGRQLPKFYSSSLCMDLYPQRDMERRLVPRRLLRFVEGDATPAGDPLIQALRDGRPADDVAAWAETPNNTGAAQAHYVQRHKSSVGSVQTAEGALAWIQDAEMQWQYVSRRLEDDSLEASDGAHLTPWRAAIEAVAG